MKQLTQEVFKDTPDWVRSAAVDNDGSAYRYECKKSGLSLFSCVFEVAHLGDRSEFISMGFDTTNWQLSAIDREY